MLRFTRWTTITLPYIHIKIARLPAGNGKRPLSLQLLALQRMLNKRDITMNMDTEDGEQTKPPAQDKRVQDCLIDDCAMTHISRATMTEPANFQRCRSFLCKTWDSHPFTVHPPFMLCENGFGTFCPRLWIDPSHSISQVLGVGILVFESAGLMLFQATGHKKEKIRLLLWLHYLQTHKLNPGISLLDTAIYPDLRRPGIEAFRRKVWVLLSLIGSIIILPDGRFESLVLEKVDPDYKLLSIRLHIRSKADAIYLPAILDSPSAFETWLKNVDVFIFHLSNSMNILRCNRDDDMLWRSRSALSIKISRAGV